MTIFIKCVDCTVGIILNASKTWLRSHGATSSEIPVLYVYDLRNLLHQPYEEEYLKLLKELKNSWSQPFIKYYMSEIHSKVKLRIIIIMKTLHKLQLGRV